MKWAKIGQFQEGNQKQDKKIKLNQLKKTGINGMTFNGITITSLIIKQNFVIAFYRVQETPQNANLSSY